MELNFFGVFIMALTAAGSFLFGRWLSRRWRDQRRAKDLAAARASETRQQRRARERRERR